MINAHLHTKSISDFVSSTLRDAKDRNLICGFRNLNPPTIAEFTYDTINIAHLIHLLLIREKTPIFSDIPTGSVLQAALYRNLTNSCMEDVSNLSEELLDKLHDQIASYKISMLDSDLGSYIKTTWLRVNVDVEQATNQLVVLAAHIAHMFIALDAIIQGNMEAGVRANYILEGLTTLVLRPGLSELRDEWVKSFKTVIEVNHEN